MVASTGGGRQEWHLAKRGEDEKRSSSPREPSFRVYYSVATREVPFEWEVRPGTPKHPSADVRAVDPPPLTPPPSYLHPAANNPNPPHPPNSRPGLIAAVLPRLRLSGRQRPQKPHAPAAMRTCSSPVSSSSSSSTPTTPRSRTPSRWTTSRSGRRARARNPSWGSSSSTTFSADERDVHDSDDGPHDTPASVSCFGVGSAGISALKKSLISATASAKH